MLIWKHPHFRTFHIFLCYTDFLYSALYFYLLLLLFLQRNQPSPSAVAHQLSHFPALLPHFLNDMIQHTPAQKPSIKKAPFSSQLNHPSSRMNGTKRQYNGTLCLIIFLSSPPDFCHNVIAILLTSSLA